MKKMLLTAIIMGTSMNIIPLNYQSQQNNDLNNIITAKEQITLANADLGFFQTYINTFMKLQNQNINWMSLKTELINEIDEVLIKGDYKNIGVITRLYELKNELIATDDKTMIINLLDRYSSDIRDKVKNNLQNMVLILEKMRKKDPSQISHLISRCHTLINRISSFNLDNKDTIISFLFEVIQFKDAVIIQLTNMMNNLTNIASDEKYNIIKIKLEQIRILQNKIKDLKEEIAIAQIGITKPEAYYWDNFHAERKTNFNWLRYYQPKLNKISFTYDVYHGQAGWVSWIEKMDDSYHEIYYNNLPMFYDDLSDDFTNSSIWIHLDKKYKMSHGWWVYEHASIKFKNKNNLTREVGGRIIENVNDIGIWWNQYLVIKNFKTTFHLNKKYTEHTLINLQEQLKRALASINKLENEIRLLEN
ncbi:hypothetical protein [Spiroplasma sp. SV19]|uniref:hypothetical protein n=1 Tax=Spiroplasma sp. SV19 TaxID=2570468 RepID=UPI0024B6E8D0|nr:hypothetical protein [Spiroplasma sp. SV19]WHQ37297.1 hypothetical protein E7Y35_05385 [Spiroplasma sp. SV19]